MNDNSKRLSAVAMRNKIKAEKITPEKTSLKKLQQSSSVVTKPIMRNSNKEKYLRKSRGTSTKDSDLNSSESDEDSESEEAPVPVSQRGRGRPPKKVIKQEKTSDTSKKSSPAKVDKKLKKDQKEVSTRRKGIELNDEQEITTGASANPETAQKERDSSSEMDISSSEESKNNMVSSNEEEMPVHNGVDKKKKEKNSMKMNGKLPTKEESAKNNRDFKGISPRTIQPKISTSVSCGNLAAKDSFKWLLCPYKPDIFFKEMFDQKPFYLQRKNSSYYKGLFSAEHFDKLMKENNLDYDEIDIVRYDGERKETKGDMKVFPGFIWSCYNAGNSIRMSNPQSYHKPLWKLCSLLQEYFASYVGVNMYLTPAGSQGFPPHYDDIDAFILQIEGKKRWKLYRPRNASEFLTRYSSEDIVDEDLGQPFMEVVLNPGDLFYFPRGVIHEACTSEDFHSLHLTVSVNQLNTWGDFLHAGIAKALDDAIDNDIEFRKSIPKDYFDFAGAAFAKCQSAERDAFKLKAKSLLQKMVKYFSVDYAADNHGTDFIHGSIPPFFNKIEAACSVHGDGSHIENGEAVVTQSLTPETKIRLIRKRSFRLVLDEDGAKLFYSLANSRTHKGKEALFVDVDDDIVPTIVTLLRKCPDFIKVDDLPILNYSSEEKVELAQSLYLKGFLMTEAPL